MAQMQKRQIQEVHQELEKVEKKIAKRCPRALELVEISQIQSGGPKEFVEMAEKMQLTPCELQEIGVPDGLFSFNDPAPAARKLHMMEMLSKIEPKLAQLENQMKTKKIFCNTQVADMKEKILKIQQEMKKEEMQIQEPKMLQMVGGLAVGAAVLAQMPMKVQSAVAIAGFAGGCFKIYEKMGQMAQMGEKMTEKIMKKLELEMLKVREQQAAEKELQLQIFKEISEMKIFMADVMMKIGSQEFCMTLPGGNQVRSFMKVVEKLSYLEIRFMNLLLDSHEAKRKLGQDLEKAMSFTQMKTSGIQIADEFISARLRFKDHLKIDMKIILGQWKEIADGAAKEQILEADRQIDWLKKEDGKASEMQMWQSWREQIVQFQEIAWENEVTRFQMV